MVNVSFLIGASNKFNYQVGKSYVYNYELDQKFISNGNLENSMVIYHQVTISVLRPCEFRLKLSNIRSDQAGLVLERKDEMELYPIRFLFHNGVIEETCPSPSDQMPFIAAKQGILSTFQKAHSCNKGMGTSHSYYEVCTNTDNFSVNPEIFSKSHTPIVFQKKPFYVNVPFIFPRNLRIFHYALYSSY